MLPLNASHSAAFAKKNLWGKCTLKATDTVFKNSSGKVSVKVNAEDEQLNERVFCISTHKHSISILFFTAGNQKIR